MTENKIFGIFLQAKHSTVYQKPGPPTPGNTNRRNSRGTPGRGLHSPRSPLTSANRKRTPKRTPKKTPKKPESANENLKVQLVPVLAKVVYLLMTGFNNM